MNTLNPEIIKAIDTLKGKDICQLDVSTLTDMTDTMIVATGTSSRHIKAIADSVISTAKSMGISPLGAEGDGSNGWVLVDIADTVVHIMLAETRAFYDLENLWSLSPRP